MDSVSRPGNLFNLNESWPLQLALAGRVRVPVWAFATTYPLYVGFRGASWWGSLAPYALLVYGLCVVGGALHCGIVFTIMIPQVLHHPQMHC